MENYFKILSKLGTSRLTEEHGKSRHFLINASVPKFPKYALEPRNTPE